MNQLLAGRCVPNQPANLEEDGGDHGARPNGRSKDIKRSSAARGADPLIKWIHNHIII